MPHFHKEDLFINSMVIYTYFTKDIITKKMTGNICQYIENTMYQKKQQAVAAIKGMSNSPIPSPHEQDSASSLFLPCQVI